MAKKNNCDHMEGNCSAFETRRTHVICKHCGIVKLHNKPRWGELAGKTFPSIEDADIKRAELAKAAAAAELAEAKRKAPEAAQDSYLKCGQGIKQ